MPLDESKDVYGRALYDYYKTGKSKKLQLYTSYGKKEVMPVDWFFRDENDFPKLEWQALQACRGKILDMGAGVGSHAVFLVNQGKEVHTLDTSPFCARIMQQRGLPVVFHQDLWAPLNQKYDTLLMLMNGIGIVGTLEGLRQFLMLAKKMLLPGGQIIFDSSDLSYLYPDISLKLNPYLGEIKYTYQYQKDKGETFTWLYIDQKNMRQFAEEADWQMNILYEDNNDQYLATLHPK